MKLLIVTQAIDQEHPVLGFFHDWIAELAPRFEGIEAICLYEGRHTLPENVRVRSLGKEKGRHSRITYALRFLRLVWSYRHEYDAAFVHMNQEYVLLAGMLWKAMGKRIYMWRNHYAGSWLTDIAARFCTKVFCTSRYSYTARYRKTVLMPVGVDTRRFFPDARITRRKNSILFLARMAPSKNPLVLLDALKGLREKNVPFAATFVGSPLHEHEAYYRSVVGRATQYGLTDAVTFTPGVPKQETPDLYRAHEIFVNTSPSGMLDKTIFEAAACGCLVLAASVDFAQAAGTELHADTSYALTERLEEYVAKGESAMPLRERLDALVREHALSATMEKLARELS